MNIRDLLNSVTEGPERSWFRRRAPAPVLAPRQPSQPPPPTPPPVQARRREWVIIARGDFPKGQPHQDNRFVRLSPPLHDGEKELRYHLPFSPLPEVGPYEILDAHIIQSPMPERYINVEPELPNSELHEDALKVIEDTSCEKVIRVWVECESAGGSRKAVFIGVEHVHRLPRIDGWQVVKKSGVGALTRYMVMVAPDGTGQTPLKWVWMTVPEIREQLPEQCDELVQEYREYHAFLLRAEAEAEEEILKERTPSRLKRRQEGQPVQIEANSGGDCTNKTDESEEEATEIDSDGYDQPPSPKRQRVSPVASSRVAGIFPQLPSNARISSPAPSLNFLSNPVLNEHPSTPARHLDLEPGASYSEGEVNIDDLDLFPEPESHGGPPGSPHPPTVGGSELDDLDLDLDLDRATRTNFPVRYSPSVPTSLSTDSPLSTLPPSPSRPPLQAPPVELAPLRQESPLRRGSSSPSSLPRGSVYLQSVAYEVPLRRSARLGARGQAEASEVLMKLITKEPLVKAKKKGVSAPTPSNSAAPAQRRRSRLATATATAGALPVLLEVVAGGLNPVPKRGHGKPKGSVGKKKFAHSRAGTAVEVETKKGQGRKGQGKKGQEKKGQGKKGQGKK